MSSKAHASIYRPINPQKYQGDPTNIICRSSWERKFCHWCDTRPGIIRWASEEFYVPYVKPTDMQIHRYFPDFRIDVQSNDGTVKTFVVEIKPKHQAVAPPVPKRKSKKYLAEVATYAINQAKWQAAQEYCRQRNWTFMVVTEDHLFGS